MRRPLLGSIVAVALVLGCEEGPDDDEISTAPACTDDLGCPEGSVCVQGLYCRGVDESRRPPAVVVIGPGTDGQDAAASDAGSQGLDAGFLALDGGAVPRFDGGSCVGAQLACAGVCVDPQSDPLHCGGCGIVCTGGRSCTGGVCCGAADQVCGDTCVDLTRDPRNCGTCGLACPVGTECSLGACVTPLPGASI